MKMKSHFKKANIPFDWNNTNWFHSALFSAINKFKLKWDSSKLWLNKLLKKNKFYFSNLNSFLSLLWRWTFLFHPTAANNFLPLSINHSRVTPELFGPIFTAGPVAGWYHWSNGMSTIKIRTLADGRRTTKPCSRWPLDLFTSRILGFSGCIHLGLWPSFQTLWAQSQWGTSLAFSSLPQLFGQIFYPLSS